MTELAKILWFNKLSQQVNFMCLFPQSFLFKLNSLVMGQKRQLIDHLQQICEAKSSIFLVGFEFFSKFLAQAVSNLS